VASKFPLFISQDGINGEVKKKALSYNEITYMQVWNSFFLYTYLPKNKKKYTSVILQA
jgi:alpha-1,3-mannosyl-glycoprotein beta-1,2-N-acetylglucosaminyltransferase